MNCIYCLHCALLNHKTPFILDTVSTHGSVSVDLPAGINAVGFGLKPGCVWAGFIVDNRLRAVQSQ